MKRTSRIGLVLLLAAAAVGPATSREVGDYGDAPEGAIAYPNLGVAGNFPTCVAIGPNGFIYHSPLGWAKFVIVQPGFDTEPDGNAGTCPPPPYDLDECFADADAGLILPPAYSIVAGGYVPCTQGGPPLGQACTAAAWGPNVDISVANAMPVVGYVNVLMDWDQSGFWGGSSLCPPNMPAPEHVLVNFPIPIGYGGPLSALNPPPFLIGPNSGFIWTRFTISETPVAANWDGVGYFEDGETEDYLLPVDPPTASRAASWGSIRSLYR